jgi:hypothetical protein
MNKVVVAGGLPDRGGVVKGQRGLQSMGSKGTEGDGQGSEDGSKTDLRSVCVHGVELWRRAKNVKRLAHDESLV